MSDSSMKVLAEKTKLVEKPIKVLAVDDDVGADLFVGIGLLPEQKVNSGELLF